MISSLVLPSRLYKTPDKTRIWEKDHFDRKNAAYTLVITLK
ncbi:MAG: hypothetical protein NTW38_09370 [Candidatus Aminicenantes bacterium]|nr:hypothetical protein [Candidatus Aminicenantes bacterium]